MRASRHQGLFDQSICISPSTFDPHGLLVICRNVVGDRGHIRRDESTLRGAPLDQANSGPFSVFASDGASPVRQRLSAAPIAEAPAMAAEGGVLSARCWPACPGSAHAAVEVVRQWPATRRELVRQVHGEACAHALSVTVGRLESLTWGRITRDA
jgi:hypothetical protein